MTNGTGEWTRCGPHEISKLAGRIRARRGRRAVGGAAILVAAACVAIAVVLYPRPDEGPDFAGISCERVVELSDAYMTKRLSPELQDQMSRHIALCPQCRPRFQNMPRVSGHRRGGATRLYDRHASGGKRGSSANAGFLVFHLPRVKSGH